ncbi:MAG TPA: ATP-binding protein [Arachnia sp.]|nr:ATP-binding protein [Arachnia sp.]HMT86258.1 ATP-binding protein [Arachnia sp.]
MTWKRIGGEAVGIVVVLAFLVIGWFEARLVFRLTGEPPALVGHLLAVAFAAASVALTMNIVARVRGRSRDGRVFFAEMKAALDRISQGDFSVRLDTEGRGPLADVIESVNRMADELGTLEQRRQDFVSHVSHEIHSPLTSIKGFAELLRDPDLDEATRLHYLDIIAAECRRLSGLSENLLRLSALDDAELARDQCRLDEQVREVIVSLESQWSAKRIAVELEAEPAPLVADADLLWQVWANLLHNAIKFTPDGGRIRVTVTTGADGGATVEVADNGIGVAESDLPRLFERFYRVDKARGTGGAGLGLALAKRIVQLHGGLIAVSSAPGEGTTMTVTLPASFTAR